MCNKFKRKLSMKSILVLFLLALTTSSSISSNSTKFFMGRSKNNHYKFTQYTDILSQDGHTCGYHALWNIITNDNQIEQMHEQSFNDFFDEYYKTYGEELTQVELWEICEDKNLKNVLIIQSLDLMENEMFAETLLPALHREGLDTDKNTESLAQIAQQFNMGQKIYCIINISNERNDDENCTADSKKKADLGHWVLVTAQKKVNQPIEIDFFDSLKVTDNYDDDDCSISSTSETNSRESVFINIIPHLANSFTKFLCKFINHYDNPAQYQNKVVIEIDAKSTQKNNDRKTQRRRKQLFPQKS